MEVRFFSPDEARAAIPMLRPLLAELRDAWHAYRFHREQLDELVALHGASLDERGHPEHDEAARLRDATEDHLARVEHLVAQIEAIGAQVKDPLLGLIDFHHRRADGSVVLLCYRDDEETLGWWHPIDTGFTGRRPLAEL